MGNGTYCAKLKTTKTQKKSSIKSPSIPNLQNFPSQQLLEQIKFDLEHNFEVDQAISFLLSTQLNALLVASDQGFRVSNVVKIMECKDNEIILDISNKIYVEITNQQKKLNVTMQKERILMNLIDSMKNILENQLAKVSKVDLNNLQYEATPLKYFEIMLEFYQIITTYTSGNMKNAENVWWDKQKYGEDLQYYESRFIDLAGKIRYEIEFMESVKVRANKQPRRTFSSVGYGLKRTQIKKNTCDIRDASLDIQKEKQMLQNVVKKYLIDLNKNSYANFKDIIKVLKDRNENVMEDLDEFGFESHRVPITRNLIVKQRKKKR